MWPINLMVTIIPLVWVWRVWFVRLYSMYQKVLDKRPFLIVYTTHAWKGHQFCCLRCTSSQSRPVEMVPFYQMKESAIISSTRQRTNKTKCLSLSNMLWCSSYGWNSCCHPGIYKSTYLLDHCVLPVLNFHFSFYQLVSGNNNQTFLTFDFLHLLMLE